MIRVIKNLDMDEELKIKYLQVSREAVVAGGETCVMYLELCDHTYESIGWANWKTAACIFARSIVSICRAWELGWDVSFLILATKAATCISL